MYNCIHGCCQSDSILSECMHSLEINHDPHRIYGNLKLPRLMDRGASFSQVYLISGRVITNARSDFRATKLHGLETLHTYTAVLWFLQYISARTGLLSVFRRLVRTVHSETLLSSGHMNMQPIASHRNALAHTHTHKYISHTQKHIHTRA